jgi:hypothetical protein
MAAVNPQGSKPGLIIALVIFVIGFVVATVYAIYFNAQWTKTVAERDSERSQRIQYANDADVVNPDVKKFADATKKPAQSVIDLLMVERESLAKDITGTPNTPTAVADAAAKAASTYATGRLTSGKVTGVTLPPDLASQIKNLSDAIVTLDAARIQAQADRDAAAAATVKATADRDAMLKDKDTLIAQANADRDKAAADRDAYMKTKGDSVTQIQADADQKLKDVQAAPEKLQTEITNRDSQLKVLVKDNETLLRRLRDTRVNVTEAMIQQPDGVILRAPSLNTVFINIGQKQSVTAGLTFEVYDKIKGIPPMGNGMRDAEMPAGKASIEVIHVLPTSAECRVIHTELGETITEGDLIMNLVFDPNAKYKFLVYGNFDMTNEATPNSTDADVIKRLVSQWGGRLVTAVDVNTDFVVLGAEPEVPVLSADDQNDPTKVKQRDDKQAALDAYLDVQAQAVRLGIPIMNQNRFLYFVGYYDQASK